MQKQLNINKKVKQEREHDAWHSIKPYRMPLAFACLFVLAACDGGSAASSNSNIASSVNAVPNGSSAVTVSSVASSSSVGVSSIANSISSSASVVHKTCPSTAEQAYQMYAGKIGEAIEAENFDISGYSDATPGNEGMAYRDSTDVDVKEVDGGYAVGWLTNGEFLDYTIYVEQAGEYDLTIRSGAVGNGRALQISQCGDSLVESFDVPSIANWGDFKTRPAGKIQLEEGYQKIRITVSGEDYMDLDWIHIGPYAGVIDPEQQTCDLPTSFEWEASAPLISPRNGVYGIKDPSVVYFDDKYHIFATINDDNWKSVYLNFSDWGQAASANQISMQGTRGGNTVAPQVFYYRPHNLWYNFTQWPRGYNTNTDISDVNGWTARRDFLRNGPPTESNKPELDYWNICDDTHCHLFFSRDDGVLYKSKTTRENFPNFDGYEIVMEDHRGNGNSFLFEAANVYKVDGSNKYLLLVEAYRTPGYGPRYFRSWTATSLDGPWTALADTEENPFAGNANVDWAAGKWADGISHGEMIRSGYDEYLTIDPCDLQFLFQGDSGESLDGGYGGEPYKLGLLKLKGQ